MKPKSIKQNLPKINKSTFVQEKNLNNSLIKQKNTSADINNHYLFRQPTMKLKEQKMKEIIQRNHNKFFSNEMSLSNISQIKEEKNISFSNYDFPQNFKRNTSYYFSKSKESSIFKSYFPNLFKKNQAILKDIFLTLIAI